MKGSVLLLTLALCLSVVAQACLDPDVGDLVVPFCQDVDSNPAASVSFADDIMPLLQRPLAGCDGCHDPQSLSAPGFTIGGLDLTSHATLLAGGANSAATIVVPGAPCESVLYLKLSAAPPSGARMPANGPPFFTTDELTLVHDWIAEGGLEN